MKGFLSFLIGVFFAVSSYANDVSSIVENIDQDKNIEQDVIAYEIKKEIHPLPTCDDEKLMQKTKEFIENYYKQNINNSVIERRKRYFILRNLNNFTKENIANYKTEKSRPVSDVVAEVKVNENIIEENMLLCKNQNLNKYINSIYLLVYPYNNRYKVFLLNLDNNNNFFEYENSLM